MLISCLFQIMSCPGCRKPLPRCSLCLIHMGTSSTMSQKPRSPGEVSFTTKHFTNGDLKFYLADPFSKMFADIHLVQKRLSSELLHCALLRSTMDVTNLYIVAYQDRKAICSTLLPWLIHECRCLIVGTCNAI